ncbi:restriction endonuclease subunit S [Chlorobaculum sp. 24CR]|uniref:restriction endonuclease subunit S n=1 Tax=Chlorobaculum sp. 24CR TaxID=2508878 RepID=UPI00100B3D63|nr:restriction endonuclease subunit S [Chlorobaculum sp. 24CR]RXK88203.1 restriction endonuclease subunit S [Chlorobaculum sp. 24CR]
MSSEWNTIKLKDFADINPRRTIIKNSLVPYIEMSALPMNDRDIPVFNIGTRLNKSGGGSKFQNGDTLLARITPCLENGKTGLVQTLKNNECGLGSTEFIVLGPRSNDDINFLYYLSKSPEFRDYAIARMEGTSGRQRVSRDTIGEYRFLCPPIIERKTIGALLAALDDRIALLRETNATLESIAQAIFKSWFIDFDPVKARQQGQEPQGMDAATAALFPDAFQDSELGPIPAGWEVLSLGELVCTVGGGTPSTKDISYWQPAEFAWTTPKDLSAQDSPVLLKTERMISAKGVEKLSSGLLPKGTLLLSSRAPIGYLAIAGIPLCINQGYIAILPDSVLSPLYMLFWCKNHMELIKNRSNGSTFLEINKKSFRGISAIKPPDVLLKCFTDLITPVFDRIVENEQKSQTLVSIRDALLPRLISGKLRLPEAEAMVGEAGL